MTLALASSSSETTFEVALAAALLVLVLLLVAEEVDEDDEELEADSVELVAFGVDLASTSSFAETRKMLSDTHFTITKIRTYHLDELVSIDCHCYKMMNNQNNFNKNKN